MSYEVTGRHENLLLARVELEVVVLHDQKPTPTREDVRKAVAESESTKPALVIVKRMEPEFGMGRTRGWVHVYKDAEGLRRMEPHHLLVRHGLEEAQPDAPAAAAAPAKEKAPAPKA
ncbi:MAG TPA: 30S ribosomal protein S24e [Candidatus Thermoplasmatota archaeon]